MVSFFYFIGLWHRGEEPTARELRTKLFYFIYHLLFSVSLVAGIIKSEKPDEIIFLVEVLFAIVSLHVKLWNLIWKQNQILDMLNRTCVFSIRFDDDVNIFHCKLNGFRKFVIIFCVLATFAGLMILLAPLLVFEKALIVEIGFLWDYTSNEIAFWMANTFLFTEAVLSMIVTFYSIIIWYLLFSCSLRYHLLGNELKRTGHISEEIKDEVSDNQKCIIFMQDLKALIDVHLHLRGYNNKAIELNDINDIKFSVD